jgi:DNA-binding response OmpR family regulator
MAHRILLVDDEVTLRNLIARALRKDYDVVEASDGFEAWGWLRKRGTRRLGARVPLAGPAPRLH